VDRHVTSGLTRNETLDPLTLRARLALFVLLALFALVLTRTAWVCDDAYITFRTVANLLHGNGARWNVAERVQAYTHPLWMLMLAAIQLVTHEPYFTSIAASIILSLSAVSLVAYRTAHTGWQAIAGVLILVSSKAFVDFSTSGLENALSHLLIAGYVVALMAPRAAGISWRPIALASLALVNRQDFVCLLGPSVLAYIVLHRSARAVWSVAAGLAPLVAWEVFSLVYYGFAVPNTAFAKISTGIPEADLLRQGARYLQESWQHDPVTLTVITISAVIALVSSSRVEASGPARSTLEPVLSRTLACGQCLYLGYVVWIGGDFMSGRFLAAPLLVGVAQLAAMPLRVGQAWQWASGILIVVLGALPAVPNVLSGPRFGAASLDHDFYGIADERESYYPRTGLLRAPGPPAAPDLPNGALPARMLAAGQRVATREMVGMFGYAAGPDLYVVDWFGLGDPLLARLPASGPWRIGHFRRNLPDGYIQTLRTGQNQIRDPGVAAYYDALVLITRGPVFSLARLRAIVAMQLGQYDHWLDQYRATLPQ
jgi:arabinofuranosyltransferase